MCMGGVCWHQFSQDEMFTSLQGFFLVILHPLIRNILQIYLFHSSKIFMCEQKFTNLAIGHLFWSSLWFYSKQGLNSKNLQLIFKIFITRLKMVLFLFDKKCRFQQSPQFYLSCVSNCLWKPVRTASQKSQSKFMPICHCFLMLSSIF